MKFTYDFIKENIRIYNLAKQQIPIISQFESGEVSLNAMRYIGLDKFAEFYNFSKNKDLIRAISFKELKEVLVENTKNERFKTYLKNRTQKQFIKLLTEDGQTFDRLLNGRWISKPSYYKARGRRSNERIDSFLTEFSKLINFIISNDIDTFSSSDFLIYKSFHQQDLFQQSIKWYTDVLLDIDVLPKREIEVTTGLVNSLVDFIVDSNLDFRKLNSDFLIDSINNKIRILMDIPNGTQIKAMDSLVNGVSGAISRLTKDKFYTVESSTISNGYLRVCILDDTGFRNYYDYKYFEDISIQRDLLLNQLGII
jgi:hypothetical protein